MNQTNKLTQRIKTARLGYLKAIHSKDQDAQERFGRLMIDANADLADLVMKLQDESRDVSRDQFLVLSTCDLCPDGVVVPKEWLPQMRRLARGPLTIVRVADTMIKQVNEELNR